MSNRKRKQQAYRAQVRRRRLKDTRIANRRKRHRTQIPRSQRVRGHTIRQKSATKAAFSVVTWLTERRQHRRQKVA